MPDEDSAEPALRALIARIDALVDLESEADAEVALAELLRRLQAEQVSDEIALILESGTPTGAALARYRELEALRRTLKGAA